MTIIPPDISIVILTFNKPDLLKKCLDSIPSGVEIVITDDGTVPMLDEQGLYDKVYRYVWQEHKGNRASTARNRGFELVTKPKVLFLDGDVELHPMALAAHSIALNMYDVSFGLLPRVKWQPFTDDRQLFYFREDQIGWNYCWSGNLAIRSDAFRYVGGFDDLYDGGHGFEDLDIARQLQLAEFRLHFNRMAMAHHPATHTALEPGEPDDLVLVNQRKYQKKWGDDRVAPSRMGD